jgi:hypothetical protein
MPRYFQSSQNRNRSDKLRSVSDNGFTNINASKSYYERNLTLYFKCCFLEILNCNCKESLFTFSARPSCLSAAQNAPSVGFPPPVDSEPYAADKQEKRAEK